MLQLQHIGDKKFLLLLRVLPTHATSVALSKALREILREVRLDAGLSLNELGKRSGVDRVSISFIEQGKRIPSIETLAKIALGLEIPTSSLWKKAERRVQSVEKGEY